MAFPSFASHFRVDRWANQQLATSFGERSFTPPPPPPQQTRHKNLENLSNVTATLNAA